MRRAIRPTLRLPATSWAEPGRSRVISMSVMARRNRTRAARSSVVKRGPWRSCDPGEETGGIEMPLCCSAGEESCPPSITSHTRHSSDLTRRGPVSRTRAPSGSPAAWPAGGPGGSRPRACGAPRRASRGPAPGSRAACPSASIATNTKYADATCSEVDRRVVPRLVSTRTPISIEDRPAQLTWAKVRTMSPTCTGVQERHLVHRRGDRRTAAVPLGDGARGRVGQLHDLAAVDVAEQVRLALGGDDGQRHAGVRRRQGVASEWPCPHGSVSAMADRPRGNGGPEDGTPEYNWLYGRKGRSGPSDGDPDATRVVPRQPRPDETRVMPTVPPGPGRAPRPPPAGRPQPAGRPAAPPAAPPPSPSERPARGSRRPKFRAPLDPRAAPALAGLPDRGAAVGVDQGREGRRSSRPPATGPTTSPGRRTSWSAATPAPA